MSSPFELHASGISIERTEDYHTEPKTKQKKYAPKVKIAKAIVYCHTFVDRDKVEYRIMHPAFPSGELSGCFEYKDIKDEEQALFAAVWDAFNFFLGAGYHHLELVTTFKRLKSLVNGDVECQNSIEEEMLLLYNQTIRTAPMTLEFVIVEEMPKIEFVKMGDVE